MIKHLMWKGSSWCSQMSSDQSESGQRTSERVLQCPEILATDPLGPVHYGAESLNWDWFQQIPSESTDWYLGSLDKDAFPLVGFRDSFWGLKRWCASPLAGTASMKTISELPQGLNTYLLWDRYSEHVWLISLYNWLPCFKVVFLCSI